ncbi:54S ribosomal protein L3 mitochondrial [Tieghemiomyces parasiticus]|uniref:Large ribosomal subunit protein mL44 n=1 Tax=Tieghemiomyces parasiticus TaxID=78921 RepID=A0A9W8AHS6_9FUNG|nr:54S ribosomal protein L3 mitochondrial [Tieghemiomyces parasiticus]
MNVARLALRRTVLASRVIRQPTLSVHQAARAVHSTPAAHQATVRNDTDLTSEDATGGQTSAYLEGAKVTPADLAFSARLNLKFKDPQTLPLVLTDISYRSNKTPNNRRHCWLGRRVIDLYAGEYFYVKYPNVPANALGNLHDIHFSSYALGVIGKELGLPFVMRWTPSDNEGKNLGLNIALGRTVQAIVGAIYEEQGADAAKRFVHAFLLSRAFDLSTALKLDNPKILLTLLTRQKNLEHPVARLLKETGRLSNSPVFIVGMFSGVRKIGEGFGSSLKMAETRACKDALIRYYMKEIKDFELPSDAASTVGPEHRISFFPARKSPAAEEVTEA